MEGTTAIGLTGPTAAVEDLRRVTTPDERLIWYAAAASRSSQAIRGLGALDGYHGILVRDDYAGWAQFDAQLAGVQQCCQHYADTVVMPIRQRAVLAGGGARGRDIGIIERAAA